MALLAPIQMSGAAVDLSPRFVQSQSIVASPATAAETVIAQLTGITSAVQQGSGVFLFAQVAYHVGTSGTAAQYRIRQGTTAGSGTVVFDSGASTAGVTAAAFVVENIFGFDTAATLPGQAYCLTLTVASASAASTVSAVNLAALLI